MSRKITMPTTLRILLLLTLLAAGAARADLRLFILDCGSITLDDVSAFGLSNDETPVRTLFVPCYLIEHTGAGGTRRLLFDAGLPADLAGQGDVTPEPGMTLSYGVSLQDQLAAMDLAPADIDFIAFSHLHFDHVGSAALFTGSTQLMQAAEYQAGFVDRLPVYQAELYLPLADAPRQIIDGDHDVFGDDSVRLVRAPGHTPGHQVLLVRLQDPGPVVLSGDLYHFRLSRSDRRVPGFNTSPEQTWESMDRVEALLEAEGAALWIEHDLALARTLRQAPEFYQ